MKIDQLKISLDNIQPQIWRRIQVPGNISLFKLHFIFQITMGWTNSPLHEFYIGDHIYGTLFEEDWEIREIRPELDHHLDQVVPDKGDHFGYLYDFGYSWKHTVQAEDILEPAVRQRYPVCLAGGRTCPPEDVGGTWG
jgi:hypothetical protein